MNHMPGAFSADIDELAGGTSTADPRTAIFARVRIGNLRHLVAAFGEDAGTAVVATIESRAREAIGPEGRITVRGDGLDVMIEHQSDIIADSGSACATELSFGDVERRLWQLGTAPVVYDATPLLVSLQVAAVPITGLDTEIGDAVLERVRYELDGSLRDKAPRLALPDGTPMGATSYRADMMRAALAHAAITEDRVFLLWQPIFGGSDGDANLYYEGLARIADPAGLFEAGEMVSPGAFIPALERLGLIRAFDAHVVRLTVGRLKSDPSLRLGCNLSAQSAVLDRWWDESCRDFASDPALAARLTLEITETARFPSLGSAIDLVSMLRQHGCRIAVDDFGRGHMTVSDVAALAPDIIKINAFFLQHDKPDEDLAGLCHLVGLAEALSLDVVIYGVESQKAGRRATQAGLKWAQGRLLAAPALSLMPPSHAVVADDELVTANDEIWASDRTAPLVAIPPRAWVLGTLLSTVLWAAIVGGAWYCFAS